MENYVARDIRGLTTSLLKPPRKLWQPAAHIPGTIGKKKQPAAPDPNNLNVNNVGSGLCVLAEMVSNHVLKVAYELQLCLKTISAGRPVRSQRRSRRISWKLHQATTCSFAASGADCGVVLSSCIFFDRELRSSCVKQQNSGA